MNRTAILNTQANLFLVNKKTTIWLCFFTMLFLLSNHSALANESAKKLANSAKNKADPFSEQSKEENWKTWRRTKNLKVSYRPSSYQDLIEIKAQARLNSTLSGFIYFIEDLTNMPAWLDNTHSAEILEQFTASENIFITRFKGLWPVSAREMIVHSRYWQNDDLSLEIAVIDANDFIAVHKKAVRMKVHSAHWKIIPTAANQIDISYQFVVDPRGNIPQWLTKSMTLKGIWTTLNNLQEQLPKSHWQQKQKSHIQEIK